METEIRKLGTDFAKHALLSRWDALDAADETALREILREAAAAGIFGFTVPEAAGGSGLGTAEYSVFVEEVSKACAGAGAVLAAHFAGIAPLLIAGRMGIVSVLLSLVTEAEGKGQPLLFTAAAGEGAAPVLCRSHLQMGPSENARKSTVPSGDVTYMAHVDTTVERRNGTCLLTGVKAKVLGAGVADWFMVLAQDTKDETLCWVAVPRNTQGVEIRPEARRLGLRLCPVNDVVFSGAEVPSANMIARLPDAANLLEFHRFVDPAFAAISIGLTIAAREAALSYSIERYQGGKMICDHDAIQMMLADMAVSIAASRALAYGADPGLLGTAFAAEAAEQVCLDAVQVLGGYGYMKDYRIERMLRDAKTFRALAGPLARRLAFMRGEIEARR